MMDWLEFIRLVAIPAFGISVAVAGFSYNRAQGLAEALHAYKLEVAKEYASVVHLKEVEHRLAGGIEEIKDAVRDVARELRSSARPHQGGAS